MNASISPLAVTVKLLFRAAVAILTLGFAVSSEAQEYTTYRTWNELVEGTNAKYAPIRRVSNPGTSADPAYTGFWFFGIEQFDPNGRYMLGMSVPFQNRDVTPTDKADIGFIDLQNKDQWTKIGESTAWNWQQGCRLQWRGQSDEIVWNDRSADGSHFISQVYNFTTKVHRSLPLPVYDISPDGQSALTHDFARMEHGGTNYVGIRDANAGTLAPDNTGVWKMDMNSGESKMILSLKKMASLAFPSGYVSNTPLYFFREGWNPSGNRFIAFLKNSSTPKHTSGWSVSADGADIRFFYNEPSHHTWQDDDIVLEGDKLRLFRDDGRGKSFDRFGDCTANIDPTIIPGTGGDWVAGDTYPLANGYQYLFLFHRPSKLFIPLARLKNTAPQGDYRVDFHNRSSRNGRMLSFDSSYEGNGRQMYTVDIGTILDNPPKQRATDKDARRESKPEGMMRVAAAQTKNRTLDFRLTPQEVLTRVDQTLQELEEIIDKAGEKGCDAIVFPEDTLGLLKWECANKGILEEVLPESVKRMLARFGKSASKHHMNIVCCNDTYEPDSTTHNTSLFIGRDGKEIGRYHKVNLPFGEQSRTRGEKFPVFQTADLGSVGMLICYDMVFPEPIRCLALAGADVVFVPTLGGAAMGDEGDISRAAFRTRAVDNFVWLIIAKRGNGSMIISPKGTVVAETDGTDSLAIADINPFGNREAGDAFNTQPDMRGRLFRERVPDAYGILTEPHPAILDKVQSNVTKEDAIRIMSNGLTTGEVRFNQANTLVNSGKTEEAIKLYETLIAEFPTSWIDRESKDRLAKLTSTRKAASIAGMYPGDVGIERDQRVLFTDNFEHGDLNRWNEKRGTIQLTEHRPHTGHSCVHIPMEQGKDTGGDAIKWFMPGSDKVHVRFYVKFSADYQYNHHFVWLLANQQKDKWSAFGKAGDKPDGTYFSTAMEPWFAWGKNPSPGEVNLYSYYLDMEPDRKMDKYWGNVFFPPGPGKGEAASANRVIPPLDQWQCWEFMIQANTAADVADGAQAMWVDGKQVSTHTGIRWRSDVDLKVNCLWLEHYGYDGGDPTKAYWKKSQSVWFDDVVVATEYIGPQSSNSSPSLKQGNDPSHHSPE